MAKPKYYYIIVNKENGLPLVDSGRLPIFWIKKVAEEHRTKFGSTKYCTRRLSADDVFTLIRNDKHRTTKHNFKLKP